MLENTTKRQVSIGQFVFEASALLTPVPQPAQPTPQQVDKMWEMAAALGELSFAAHLLYIQEWLQGKKLTKEESKKCAKDLNTYFRRYCPHINRDVTNMELHAFMRDMMDTYKPRFTKRDVQAVFLAYQKLQQLPENSLMEKRAKVWIERGLNMMMASGYYQAAVPKKPARSMSRGVMYR